MLSSTKSLSSIYLVAAVLALGLAALCDGARADPGPMRRVYLWSSPFWPGSSLDARFSGNGSNGLCGINGAALACSTLLSNSDASGGLVQWSDGHFSSVPANTLRISDMGLLVEQSSTNSNRNSTLQGAVAGTPGTLPNNWAINTTNGLTTNVIGTGTDPATNLPYVDLQLVGTSTGTSWNIALEAGSTIAATTGQTFANSAFLSMSGGSLTNVTNWQLGQNEQTNVGGFLQSEASGTLSIPSVPTRQSAALTTSNASCAFVRPTLTVNMAASAAINITIRIIAPQIELNAFATSPILTTNAAVTRSADIVTANGPAISAIQNGKAARFVSNVTVLAGSYRLFDDNGETLLFFAANATQLSVQNSNGSITATTGSGGFYTTQQKTSISYGGGTLSAVVNGGTLVSAAIASVVPATPIYIGNRSTGDRALSGYLRRMTFGPTKNMFDNTTVLGSP